MSELDPRIVDNRQRIKDLEESIVDIQQWIREHLRFHKTEVLTKNAAD